MDTSVAEKIRKRRAELLKQGGISTMESLDPQVRTKIEQRRAELLKQGGKSEIIGDGVISAKVPETEESLPLGRKTISASGPKNPELNEKGETETPVEDKTPTKAESAAGGYFKGVSLNLDDELYGVLSAAGEEGRQYLVKLGLKDPKTNDYGDVVDPAMSSKAPSFTEEYAKARDAARDQDTVLREANPKSFIAGEIAGAVTLPTPKIGLIKNAKEMKGAVGLGARVLNAGASAAPAAAVAGFGGSEADTVSGQLKDTAVSAGIGFGAGGAGQAVGEGLGKASSTLRNLAEKYGFRAVSGKSISDAAEETTPEVIDALKKAGYEVDEASASKMANKLGEAENKKLAKVALDEGIVGAGRGAEGMKKAAKAAEKKAVAKMNQIAKSVDSAFPGTPQYAMGDKVVDEADELSKLLLQSPNPLIREESKGLINAVKTVVDDLGGDAGNSLKFSEALDIVQDLRGRAMAHKDIRGRAILNSFADTMEKDVILQMVNSGDNLPAGLNKDVANVISARLAELSGEAYKASANAGNIRAVGNLAASRATPEGTKLLTPANAILAAAAPPWVVAGKVAVEKTKDAISSPRTASTIASGLNAGSKLSAKAGAALAENAGKVGQVAATVKSDAPTWEKIKQILKSAPDSFGAYSNILASAAEKGDKQLAMTHYILSQKDPQYQAMLRENSGE